MNRDLKGLRQHYDKAILNEEDLADNPIDQFRLWFDNALQSGILEPNAMILATSGPDNVPSARTVLLKELDQEGFIFYTNYDSQKGKEIQENPKVSIVFLWLEIHRQIRITGHCEKMPKERSEAYFRVRPKDSQIGAWTSPQSEVINDRFVLENKMKEIQDRFKNEEMIPLPDNWGGYLVRPLSIEFWQGRPSRLHDRLRYTYLDNKWKIERLAP